MKPVEPVIDSIQVEIFFSVRKCESDLKKIDSLQSELFLEIRKQRLDQN